MATVFVVLVLTADKGLPLRNDGARSCAGGSSSMAGFAQAKAVLGGDFVPFGTEGDDRGFLAVHGEAAGAAGEAFAFGDRGRVFGQVGAGGGVFALAASVVGGDMGVAEGAMQTAADFCPAFGEVEAGLGMFRCFKAFVVGGGCGVGSFGSGGGAVGEN